MDQDSALNGCPKFHQLDRISGNQKVVKVFEGAANNWERVATRLYFEGNTISQIRTESQNNQLRACQTIFTQWLDGKEGLRTPRTWSTVIEALKEASLGQLAIDLKNALLSGSSTSSAMSNDEFHDFLTREGLMDADWKKMCDNGIGVKAFAELTEEDINDSSLGFSFGGKKILKKVLTQVKASGSSSTTSTPQTPSGQKVGSTTSSEADTVVSGPHLTIKDLQRVNDEIRAARAKWYYLCLTLELDPDELDSIERACRGNPDDCLTAALKVFLKRAKPKPTWKMIVDALSSPGVGFGMLAEEIQKKHIR